MLALFTIVRVVVIFITVSVMYVPLINFEENVLTRHDFEVRFYVP